MSLHNFLILCIFNNSVLLINRTWVFFVNKYTSLVSACSKIVFNYGVCSQNSLETYWPLECVKLQLLRK